MTKSIGKPPDWWRSRQAPTCSNCIYFKRESPIGGTCHRYPPSDKGWPWVAEKAFCGEYQRRLIPPYDRQAKVSLC